MGQSLVFPNKNKGFVGAIPCGCPDSLTHFQHLTYPMRLSTEEKQIIKSAVKEVMG